MRREDRPGGAELADLVAAERAAQGLPPTITDPTVLAAIATILAPVRQR